MRRMAGSFGLAGRSRLTRQVDRSNKPARMGAPNLGATTMLWFVALLLMVADTTPRADKYFKITVVDEQTCRGVPLVELRTTNNLRYVTDSNGIVAFHKPGLMTRTVSFTVMCT